MKYETKDYSGKLASYFISSPLSLILGVAILIFGLVALELMPREENPQMVVSGSSVIVQLPGANTDEVNEIVTKPLERKLKEIVGIENITTKTHDDYAIVNVAFRIGEEKTKSNVNIYDKIMKNMDVLPVGTKPPLVKTLDIDIDIPIISISFFSDKLNITELSTYVEEIQYKVNSLNNIAETKILGEKKNQFNVLVDPKKINAHHLSIGQIAEALKAITYNLPAFTNQTENSKLSLIKVKNVFTNINDIENIIVAQYMGAPIYLKDVAQITEGNDIQNHQEANIYLKKGDVPQKHRQVTLTVSKLKGSNAVSISAEVTALLEELKTKYEENGVKYIITRNDGNKANEAVNELVHHLIISILVIGVLLIFALGFKEALIVIFSVPAILAITLLVAYLTGQTINRITLFAFLLSLGLLVDAAIIVIENIHRHMHIIHKSEENIDKDLTKEEILVRATDEVGPPTNIATLAIILTMLPMLFVGGMMGQFMKPIPINVPVALVASLVVAYIFTPYLANKLMKKL